MNVLNFHFNKLDKFNKKHFLQKKIAIVFLSNKRLAIWFLIQSKEANQKSNNCNKMAEKYPKTNRHDKRVQKVDLKNEVVTSTEITSTGISN